MNAREYYNSFIKKQITTERKNTFSKLPVSLKIIKSSTLTDTMSSALDE